MLLIELHLHWESMQTDTLQTTTYSKQNTFQAGEKIAYFKNKKSLNTTHYSSCSLLS